MHDFNKKFPRFARPTRETTRTTRETTRPTRETTRTTRETTRTTCRRQITREFGLKSRKKKFGGVEIVKKKLEGGSNGNILIFFLA